MLFPRWTVPVCVQNWTNSHRNPGPGPTGIADHVTPESLDQLHRNPHRLTAAPICLLVACTGHILSQMGFAVGTISESATLACQHHLALLSSRSDEFLPKKFPSYDTFRRRPFAFVGKRDEIIGTIAKRMHAPLLLRPGLSSRWPPAALTHPTVAERAIFVQPFFGPRRRNLWVTGTLQWAPDARLARPANPMSDSAASAFQFVASCLSN
jgi:hypothetical protein